MAGPQLTPVAPFGQSALVAIARVINAIFFLITSTYCLLTYSPFAYQQFIKPHLVAWLAEFTVWHHLWFWVALGMTALTMIRELPRAKGRAIGWGYLAVSAAVGVALLVRPVLPQVENDSRGLLLALVALLFPIWLAVYDHFVTSGRVRLGPTSEGRVFRAAVLAAALVWALQTAAAPWRLPYAGEITFTAVGLAFGAARSAIEHLMVFGLLLVIVLVVFRAGRRVGGGTGEYWSLVGLSAVAAGLVANGLVFGAISFRGPGAWMLSIVLGIAASLLWSSLARRLLAGPFGIGAFEAWLAPLPGGQSRRLSVLALVALAVIGHVAIARLMTFDWDFLLQKLCMLLLWLAVFRYCVGALSDGVPRVRWVTLVAPALVGVTLWGISVAVQPRLPRWLGTPSFVPEFVLEGYISLDPSYRVVRQLLRVDSAEDAEFYAHLQAHTNLDAPVAPVDVDFVRPLSASDARTPPHIFLFVVDSLRRDYLSPYNDHVRFTPAFARFAADSDVFTRAFARYGGTGLAMPAVWTGGMVVHKQYVIPFHPMNTLEKLLDAHGYHKTLSLDHISAQILKPSASTLELDRGVPEMQYNFCRTLDEMQAVLPSRNPLAVPGFWHTRSLNLHIAHVRDKPVPEGASYDGFVPPVAAEVQRIDACFGTFIDALQRAGLYDDSIIILTSDHGDSLGESLRWGHAYGLVSDVIRIPLIIRVPPRLRATVAVDPDAISFSTDIAPTLYGLLGHHPRDLGSLFGTPLFVPTGTDLSWRRQEPYLIASSYGAVYGVVRDNGDRLYIADGMNVVESEYDLTGPLPVRIGISPEDRARNRTFVRSQLEKLAGVYGYTPGH